MKNVTAGLSLIMLLLSGFMAPVSAQEPTEFLSQEVRMKIDELKRYTMEQETVKKNLDTFEALDLITFSNQVWGLLNESHSLDVKVNWPDGHSTRGIEKHIEDLEAMFVYAPDTSIRVHPLKFGAGEYTAVIGEMTGTFTRPMPIGDEKFIQPTNKKFSVTMCTIGHWVNGVMVEKWLFWDNATLMKQIGIGN